LVGDSGPSTVGPQGRIKSVSDKHTNAPNTASETAKGRLVDSLLLGENLFDDPSSLLSLPPLGAGGIRSYHWSSPWMSMRATGQEPVDLMSPRCGVSDVTMGAASAGRCCAGRPAVTMVPVPGGNELGAVSGGMLESSAGRDLRSTRRASPRPHCGWCEAAHAAPSRGCCSGGCERTVRPPRASSNPRTPSAANRGARDPLTGAPFKP
jgi:hypothetical protein